MAAPTVSLIGHGLRRGIHSRTGMPIRDQDDMIGMNGDFLRDAGLGAVQYNNQLQRVEVNSDGETLELQ